MTKLDNKKLPLQTKKVTLSKSTVLVLLLRLVPDPVLTLVTTITTEASNTGRHGKAKGIVINNVIDASIEAL